MSEILEVTAKSFHINSKDKNSFVDVLISAPSPVQKRTLGKLIVITQVNAEVQTKNLVNIINENIRSNYYSNINANIEFALESTLSDFNKKIKEIEKIEKIKDLKSKLSTCVIALKDSSVYFTQHGDVSSLLMYKNKIIDIAEENKVSDDKEKIFSDIIIGKVTKGSSLLFSTNSLFDYTEKEKILNHLENSNVENTVEFVKKSLDAKEKISYGIGFVLIGEKKEIKDEIVEESDEENDLYSIDSIMSDNRQMGFIKDFTNFIKRKAKSISENKKINAFIEKVKQSSKDTIQKVSDKSKENIKKGKENTAKNIKTFFDSVPETAKKVSTKTKETAKKVKEEIKKEPLKERTKRWGNNISAWYKGLGLAEKITFVSIITVIFFTILGVRIYQHKENIKKEELSYQESVEMVKSVQNEATSSLLYNNTAKAQELISNADYLIANLKTDSKTREEIKAKLEEENKNILNKVYKIINIINPSILADLSSQDSEEIININKVLSIKDNIYAFDFVNKNIYKVNENKIVEKINSDVEFAEIKAINTVSTENGNALFIDADNYLYTFDGEIVREVKLADKYQKALNNYSVDAIDSYGKTIYLLDSKNDELLKIVKGTTYGNVYSWLNSSWDFNNAISMSIDGYIYTAKSNGLVEKFLKGYNRTFSLDKISPVLNNINKIYTNEDSDNIYILDNIGARFVVFNKNNGSLLAQYLSPSFDNLKDFSIDTKNNKVYILNNNKIFEISLEE